MLVVRNCEIPKDKISIVDTSSSSWANGSPWCWLVRSGTRIDENTNMRSTILFHPGVTAGIRFREPRTTRTISVFREPTISINRWSLIRNGGSIYEGGAFCVVTTPQTQTSPEAIQTLSTRAECTFSATRQNWYCSRGELGTTPRINDFAA